MFYICFLMTVYESIKKAAEVDENLLIEIANGDSSAFSEFYTQTSTAVYSFAMSILKNPHDAEDIMQETYIKIHANADGYVSEGKPMAWVFTIVRNLCLMRIRKNKKDIHEFNDAIDYENPLNFAETLEDGEIISAAMRVLSDEERQIVVLHAVSGMKHREISSLLEMSLSTVLSKYNRALHKMKKELERKGIKNEA